jgi:ABC-type branched-subunit amino acid transport system ATPase component
VARPPVGRPVGGGLAALELVQRVLAMDNGKPIAEGTPDEIRENEQVQSVYLRSE